MPTIKARKQASGEARYTAIARIRRGGSVIHRKAKTFTHRTAAVSWAKRREVILEDPSALARVQYGAVRSDRFKARAAWATRTGPPSLSRNQNCSAVTRLLDRSALPI